MDSEFWIKAWNEGRTQFNQKSYNEKLLQFFPLLNPVKDQKVLVPLCGKAKDILWLQSLGLQVRGVELYDKAVKEFFSESNLPFEIQQGSHYKNYNSGSVVISCGDFFKLGEEKFFDLVYDRAALVALPEEMRKDYSRVVSRVMKPGGKCLLVVYEYDQTKLEGPPFSVSEKEVHDLYGNEFTIQLMENQRPANEGERLSAMLSLTQKVYILQKKTK
jgi:thiopurine S-methyltransferase